MHWDKNYYPTHQFNKVMTDKNTKLLTIIRDPRDSLISLIKALEKSEHRIDHTKSLQTIVTDILKNLDKGFSENYYGTNFYLQSKSIKEYYKIVFDQYLACPFITRFEALVGPKGGGSYKKQLQEIERIALYLNHVLSLLELENIAKKLFGNTHTFLKGQIGSWQQFASKSNMSLWKNSFGDCVTKLGYCWTKK